MRAFDTYVFPPVFVSIVMMKLCVAGKMKNVMASSRFCFKLFMYKKGGLKMKWIISKKEEE